MEHRLHGAGGSTQRPWTRLSIASIALCAVVASPTSSGAQDHKVDVIRLRWDAANVLVIPDTCAGVTLWVATNAQALVDRRPARREADVQIHPDSLQDWLVYTRQLLALEHPPVPSDTSSIVTSGMLRAIDSTLIAVGRRRVEQHLDRIVRLAIAPRERDQMMVFDLERADVDSLLDALDAAAARSAYRPTRPDSQPASVERPVAPSVRQRGPQYPSYLIEKGIEGEVWVSFVVDTNGRVDPATATVFLSDHPAFAEAVRRYLRKARYIPATKDGVPVKQLARQRFVFTIGQPY